MGIRQHSTEDHSIIQEAPVITLAAAEALTTLTSARPVQAVRS